MAPYHAYTKADLAWIASNRGLAVTSSAKYAKEPIRRDYIQALKEADSSYTFRFLELPPELRTNVYKELLILQDSFTCYPQILRTCKSINEEASNILYGDNLIEAKIHSDGVYVHGKKCGTYQPDDYQRYRIFRYGGQVPSYDLEWPELLRRAQFLKLSVVSYQLNPQWLFLPHASSGPIWYIIDSLCSFLYESNKLRSFEADLLNLSACFGPYGASHLGETLPTILCPLQYLSNLKRVKVIGADPEADDNARTFQITDNLAHKIVSGFTQPILESIRSAQRMRLTLESNDPNGNLVMTKYKNESNLPAKLPISGQFSFDKMLQQFFYAMQPLHIAWERHYPGHPSRQCREQVMGLLQLEVKVKGSVA